MQNLRLMILMVFSIWWVSPAFAERIRVSGKVIDATGKPVIGAKVVAYNQSPPLRHSIPVLDASGTFSSEVSFDGPKLNVEVSAPSYLAKQKVVLIQEGRADIGTIALDRDSSVKIISVTHLLSPSGDIQHLDVVLVNDRAKRTEVTTIGVSARRLLESRCSDSTPGTIFTLQPGRSGSWTVLVSSVDSGRQKGQWSDAFALSVRLEKGGCDNAGIQFRLPYSFSLEPGERAKVRLTLPRRVETPPITADLERWESVVFSISLAEGTAVDYAWKR
jgi:hypothetical protein